MESFRWDKHFETGLAQVDSQHHRLVDLINEFGNLLATQDSVPSEDIEALFGDLAAYARYHFKEEEEMMASAGVDRRFVESHLAQHAHFLEEVTRMHEEVGPQARNAASPLLKFLASWLAYHILGSDQVMAQQIADIKGGNSPADAFARAKLSRPAATGPLLDALHVLFEQVSERNCELSELNRTLEARVVQRTQELAQANQQLQSMALTDVLTGLPNRRHAMSCLAQLLEQARLEAKPLSCMMIDADGFKQVNDSYGHDAGDLVLRELSNQLRDAVRTDDVVARLGGDEFLIICPNTNLEGALFLAESVRRKVSTLQVRAGEGSWCGSVSIGVAGSRPSMRGPDDLIKAADEGVYAAKHNGRNCVACAQGEFPVGEATALR